MRDLDINYIKILNGSLGIGHRPKLKKLNDFRDHGVTHIWTLLSEKEGALDIKKATLKNELEWIWLPLQNGKRPEDDIKREISECFESVKAYLDDGARIYIHCSAGIHRTGMISYAFMRYIGYSKTESLAKLAKMRALTCEGVGNDRLEWGDTSYG